MDIHHLRIFLSVFRNRSFSKASTELRLSQPTVSDHIKSLEDYLECTLFERLAKKIIPTGEAEVLYNYAIEVTEKADGIRHAIGQFKKEVAGELIIGASSIPGTYLLPSLMASFKKQYPAISFQITRIRLEGYCAESRATRYYPGPGRGEAEQLTNILCSVHGG